MALVNGIYVTIAAMRPPAASKIIAQTDCLGAIHALSGTVKRARAVRQFAPIVTAYQRKIEAAGVVVELRHVSGHRGTVTPRNAVNTWCDAECHRLMRAARAAILTPPATPLNSMRD
jgi:serine/threonine-protein kinase RIO1